MDLNLRDMRILSYLINEKKSTPLKSLKLQSLSRDVFNNETDDLLNLSISSVRRSLNRLINEGYVDYGLKHGHEKTYYATEEGIKYLNNICNEE